MLKLATSLFTSAWLLLLVTGLAAAEDEQVEGEVLVTFKQGNLPAAALARHSLRLAERYDRIARRGRGLTGLIRGKNRSTAELIAVLKADPSVEIAEPNFIRRVTLTVPNDLNFPVLWGLRNTGQTVNFSTGTTGVDTRFLAAWRLARPAAGEIVVSVVDSGVDISHPDLAPNVWTNPGEIAGNGIDDDANGYIDDIHGYDFTGNTATLTDSGDHGTHVAGTIAAAGKNNIGIIGLDYRSKILPLKVSNDGTTITTSAAIAAYNYAITLKQNGANIVALNASFGGLSFSASELAAVSALGDAGIILCAAAGNGGNDDIGDDNDTTPFYPASYNTSNIISVAAISQTNALAGFSNYGAGSVDLAAPGVNIFSSKPLNLSSLVTSVSVGASPYAAQVIQYSGQTSFAGVSGTFHSCGIGNPEEFPPIVSGNIALIQRGTLTFAAKVTNAMNAGAVAAVIYDNTPDPLSAGGWQLSAVGNWIPSLRVTQATGQAILAQLPASGTVVHGYDPASAYQFLNGTSMATPHVAGAVAFAARNFPAETMAQRIARIVDHVTLVPALSGKSTTGGRLDLLKIVDTDTDGLPDWWETENFGTLAQIATADPDADDFSNSQEFLTGTSPVNSISHLAFSSLAPSANDFNLTFPSVEDNTYRIDWSDNLNTWLPLGTPVIGTGGPIQITDPNALGTATKRYYRLSLMPE